MLIKEIVALLLACFGLGDVQVQDSAVVLCQDQKALLGVRRDVVDALKKCEAADLVDDWLGSKDDSKTPMDYLFVQILATFFKALDGSDRQIDEDLLKNWLNLFGDMFFGLSEFSQSFEGCGRDRDKCKKDLCYEVIFPLTSLCVPPEGWPDSDSEPSPTAEPKRLPGTNPLPVQVVNLIFCAAIMVDANLWQFFRVQGQRPDVREMLAYSSLGTLSGEARVEDGQPHHTLFDTAKVPRFFFDLFFLRLSDGCEPQGAQISFDPQGLCVKS